MLHRRGAVVFSAAQRCQLQHIKGGDTVNIYLAGKVGGNKWKMIPSSPKSEWDASDGSGHSEHRWGYGCYFLPVNKYLGESVMVECIERLESADILVAYLDCPSSFGSIAEIAYMSALGKPSILIIKLDQTPHTHDDECYTFETEEGKRAFNCTTEEGAIEECNEPNHRLYDAYWLVSCFPHVRCVVVRSAEEAKRIAQTLDTLESPIEQSLYLHCLSMSAGSRLVGQYQLDKYRLDFAVPELRLAVECDGHDFHASKEQRGHDAARDRCLTAHGWRTLRFTGSEIHANPTRCANELNSIIAEQSACAAVS
jgi:very-short-patch-repair endonuclease